MKPKKGKKVIEGYFNSIWIKSISSNLKWWKRTVITNHDKKYRITIEVLK